MMRRVLLALVVCSLLLAVGGYALFRYKTKDLELDSAKVEALAAQLLPGAKPVAGARGVAAMEKGKLKVAVLAPSLRKAKPQKLEGGELRFAIVGVDKPPDAEAFEDLQALLAEVRAEQQEQGIETVEKSPTLVAISGRPHPALRMTQQIGTGGPMVEEYLTLLKGESGSVLLLVTGPKGSFNKRDLQTFLDGLTVAPAQPPKISDKPPIERPAKPGLRPPVPRPGPPGPGGPRRGRPGRP